MDYTKIIQRFEVKVIITSMTFSFILQTRTSEGRLSIKFARLANILNQILQNNVRNFYSLEVVDRNRTSSE